jgi:hypothetical protein
MERFNAAYVEASRFVSRKPPHLEHVPSGEAMKAILAQMRQILGTA